MKNIKFFGWIGLLAIILLASCREDSITDNQGDPKYNEPVIKVVASVEGRIIDEDNFPISDAVVKVNGEQVITDKNGIFFFNEKELNQNGTLVTAEKLGYYLGARMFNPGLGVESFVTIQLLTKELTGNFTSSTGGIITTSDQSSVSFPANSIMYENGTEYNGTVNVYIKWIDPTHDQIGDRMPGDLRAVNADEELVQLATYGMLAVELETTGGVALQIKTGEEATITMPVPAEILGVAPATIPLWSFNEETGYWVEESTATLQDGKYVGNVTHFSFWNCDAPFPVVNLCGSMVDANGNAFAEGHMEIEVDGIGVRYGYINSDGTFKGDIPKNETMTIRHIDLCGNTTYEAEIGPYSEDVILDPIVGVTSNPISIIGTLVNCDGTAVTNGYAYIDRGIGVNIFQVDENGMFTADIYICESGNLSVKGYDLDNLLESDEVEITANPGDPTFDLGNIEVCDVITEYIRIQIPELDYDKYSFSTAVGYDNTGSLEGINVFTQDSSEYEFSVQIDLESMETGVAPILSMYIFDYTINVPNGNGGYFYCDGPCGDATVTNNEGPGGRFTANIETQMEAEGGTAPYDVIIDIDLLLED